MAVQVPTSNFGEVGCAGCRAFRVQAGQGQREEGPGAAAERRRRCQWQGGEFGVERKLLLQECDDDDDKDEKVEGCS